MYTPEEQTEILTFTIDQTVCGMNILDVHEVTRVSDITSAPGAPGFVEGIVNMRGNIATIVNLGKKLELKPVEKQKENQLIIINLEGEYVGLMIDGIDTVVHADALEAEPPPANMNGVKEGLFECVLKTEDQLICILKLDLVLSV